MEDEISRELQDIREAIERTNAIIKSAAKTIAFVTGIIATALVMNAWPF